MKRQYTVGQHVIFIDEHFQRHDAPIQHWWPAENVPQYVNEKGEPGCNLVFVSADPKRDDSYGRQTEHATSVVHKSMNPARGYCWCWPDEV